MIKIDQKKIIEYKYDILEEIAKNKFESKEEYVKLAEKYRTIALERESQFIDAYEDAVRTVNLLSMDQLIEIHNIVVEE